MFLRRKSVFRVGGWCFPTLGTVCVIGAGPHTFAARALSARAFVAIGVISYPLYLWHWPLLSFPAIILQAEPPLDVRVAAVAASIALAWATYRFVEIPIRFKSRWRDPALRLASAMAIVLFCGLAITKNAGFQPIREAMVADLVDLDAAIAWPYAYNETCLDRYPYRPANVAFWFCVTNRDAPADIIIIGNSFGNDLYPGLVEVPDFSGLTVLHIGACFPIIGVDWRIPDMMPTHPCSGPRKPKVEQVIDRVIDENRGSLKVAILSATWPEFDDEGRSLSSGSFAVTDEDGNPLEPRLTDRAAFTQGLEARIEFLAQRGIATVVVMRRPELLKDIRTCFGRPLVQPASDCSFNIAKAIAGQASFREVVTEIGAKYPGLLIFDPLDIFCEAGSCSYVAEGRPLLRDPSHLSELGSRAFAQLFADWARTHLPAILAPAVTKSEDATRTGLDQPALAREAERLK